MSQVFRDVQVMVDDVPVKPAWQESVHDWPRGLLDVQLLSRREFCGRFEGSEAQPVKMQEPVAVQMPPSQVCEGVPEYSLLQVNVHAEPLAVVPDPHPFNAPFEIEGGGLLHGVVLVVQAPDAVHVPWLQVAVGEPLKPT
jgi:hypothetical protein